MGLNIAKRLVEEILEGTITVENTGPGTRFTVTLTEPREKSAT